MKYCPQKGHRTRTTPRFHCKMVQSIKTFSARVVVNIYQAIKLPVCIFYQIWAFLEESMSTKSTLFAGHCLFIHVAESCRYLQLRYS